jgi:hypothetical protein
MKEYEVKLNDAELKVAIDAVRYQLPYLNEDDRIIAHDVIDKLEQL